MFNAIKYTQELEQAGFTRQQAEAALNTLYQFSDQNLATKSDVLELKHSLNSEISEFRSQMRSELEQMKYTIEKVEYRLTIKLGAMLTVAVGILVALQRIV